MKVKIQRIAVGEILPPALELEMAEDLTVGGLIEYLGTRYHPSILAQLLDGGSVAPGILIMVNGRSIEQSGGLETTLKDGDEVFLSVMLHGG